MQCSTHRKVKKREFSDDNEEEDFILVEWWNSFCSKQRNESKSESLLSTQASTSSQSSQATNIPTQTFLELDNTKNLNSFNYFIEK